MKYEDFLESKAQGGEFAGFDPVFMPDSLYDFQKALTDWAIRKGKAAIFADCGMGKTPMQLVWAENIVRKTSKRVLILTPLAVSYQTKLEGEKFGIECKRSISGELESKIVITNYQRLHYFNPDDFAGVVCDESSILKSFDGATRLAITQFMRTRPYRLLCTATAAPNDYTELGTSSEAVGELGFMDMLNRFFKNEQGNSSTRRFHGESVKWRFKGHAEIPFWRWVASWARAIRKPSDLGFDDGKFILPELVQREHLVDVKSLPNEMLFNLPAVGLKEQRDERRRSVEERCEKVAALVNGGKKQSLVWCHLNDEGDLLEEIIPDAIQVSGSNSDEEKEERLLGFQNGKIRVLVIKPKIGAWGLNLQNCAHITVFPSHSYEQFYQGVRRCWRFGQKNPVVVDIITTEGERDVMKNLQRKSDAADRMFDSLVKEMNNVLRIERRNDFTKKEEVPAWL